MVWFKSCKRCGGDLYMQKDDYGTYVACIQCGAYVVQFDEEVEEDSALETMELVVGQRRSA